MSSQYTLVVITASGKKHFEVGENLPFLMVSESGEHRVHASSKKEHLVTLKLEAQNWELGRGRLQS